MPPNSNQNTSPFRSRFHERDRFDEEPESSPLVRFLLKHGIASKREQAQKILIISAIIILVVGFAWLAWSIHTPAIKTIKIRV
jgi:hypothetical protein